MSHQWENVLIGPECTIKDALRVIDQEALRLALVVDNDRKLLGVITDGDVRRGLINGIALDNVVAKIMKTDPLTASLDTPEERLIEMMEEQDILFIPLVKDGQVSGVQTLLASLTKPTYNNPVFIMAGGFGTRLRPLTDNCPKPMLKVGNKPILETLVENFKKAGFHRFYISTHYLPEVIHNHFGNGDEFGVSITYVHEDAPLGTGGALGLLPDDLPDLPVIMINGDVLTAIDFTRVLEFHNSHHAAATMCVREYEYQVPYGVVESEGHKIVSMVEKPIQRFFVNAGIYVLGKQVLKSVQKNEHIDMPSLLEQHIHLGIDVLKFPVHEYWLDIGRMADYKRAQVDVFDLGFSA